MIRVLFQAFSEKGKKSMSFKLPELEFLADKKDVMSFYDAMALNVAYRCAGKYGENTPEV
jgi:hypothetical protein